MAIYDGLSESASISERVTFSGEPVSRFRVAQTHRCYTQVSGHSEAATAASRRPPLPPAVEPATATMIPHLRLHRCHQHQTSRQKHCDMSGGTARTRALARALIAQSSITSSLSVVVREVLVLERRVEPSDGPNVVLRHDRGCAMPAVGHVPSEETDGTWFVWLLSSFCPATSLSHQPSLPALALSLRSATEPDC